MTDTRTFEMLLSDAYERYLAGAPVEVDAAHVAAVATSGSRRRSSARESFGRRRSWATALSLAIIMLVLVATTLLYVGREADPLPLPMSYQGVVTSVGQMRHARVAPVVVTLADGRVLVAASDVRSQVEIGPEAEIFDAIAGTSTPVRGDTPSGQGAAVLLDDGRVLTITHDSNFTASYAYVFDPVSATFHRLEQPGFSNAPPFGVEPSLALLEDGRILVAGGLADVYEDDMLASAMLFDPATETFVPTGQMGEGRRWHALTTLADGRVLVVAGEGKDPAASPDGVGSHLKGRTYIASAEIYDPVAGTFATLPTTSSIPGAAIGRLLPDGRVLIAPYGGTYDEMWLEGGMASRFEEVPPRLEIFDPETGRLSPGPILPGTVATATVLRDGRVLLTGARVSDDRSTAWTWEPWTSYFDLATETVSDGPALRDRLAPAAMLADGRVLFAGGIKSQGSINVGGVTISSDLSVFE